MDVPEDSREARQKSVWAAQSAARRAAVDLARDQGAQVISRPAYRGAQSSVQDVEPLAGLRAAREVELGARQTTRGYIRDAREAGHTWQQIGTALDLTTGGEAGTAAEEAYSYATGNRTPETAWAYGPSFAWTCGSCDGLISDRGLCNGPADDERGHADGCARLTATIAAWDAESAALDAAWEAGQ